MGLGSWPPTKARSPRTAPAASSVPVPVPALGRSGTGSGTGTGTKIGPTTIAIAIALALEACNGAPPKPAPAPAAPTKAVTPAADAKAQPEPATPTPTTSGPLTLKAADGADVHAIAYAAEGERKGVIVLFHQAGSNAAEYDDIAPRLQKLGYDALAVDQRSGGRRFGRDNETVKARGGRNASFPDAHADLEAGLAWARTKGSPVTVWGSSYSAALVFKLAAEHPGDIAALLAFSPGEYIGKSGTVAGWAAKTQARVFVTAAPTEIAKAEQVFQAVATADRTLFRPEKGVHGSSILRADANAAGRDEVWTAVEAFLSGGSAPAPNEPAP